MSILQPSEIVFSERFSSGILLLHTQAPQSSPMHTLYLAKDKSHQWAERNNSSPNFQVWAIFLFPTLVLRGSANIQTALHQLPINVLQRKGAISKSGSCPCSQRSFLLRFLTKSNPVAFLQVNSSLRLEVGFVCEDCPMQIRADEHLTNLFTDQSCWAGLSDFLSKQRTILYGHLVVPELVV